MEHVTKVLQDAKMGKQQINEVLLVGGVTRIPKVQQMVAEYFGKPANKSINPDEVCNCVLVVDAHSLLLIITSSLDVR